MSRNARVQRALELKAALVDYALEPRFEAALARVLAELVDAPWTVEDDDMTIAIETLLHGPRPDGRPPLIEHYLRRNPDLAPADRSLLQDWLDHSLFGVFAVTGRRGDSVVLRNMIDELTYEVVISAGGAVARDIARGRWTATRVVPLGDGWLQSGIVRVFADSEADLVGELVVRLAQLDPTEAFRNPDKLEQARDQLRRDHHLFSTMFDGVLTIGTGAQVADRHARFVTACDPGAAGVGRRPRLRALDSLLVHELGRLRDEPDVAMGHHVVKGMVLLTKLGAVDHVHASGATGQSESGRRLLLDYLDDESVPAWVLEELARRHPDTVDSLYAAVLGRPDFRWARDGETLLREHKPDSFVDVDTPVLLDLPPVAEAALQRMLAT